MPFVGVAHRSTPSRHGVNKLVIPTGARRSERHLDSSSRPEPRVVCGISTCHPDRSAAFCAARSGGIEARRKSPKNQFPAAPGTGFVLGSWVPLLVAQSLLTVLLGCSGNADLLIGEGACAPGTGFVPGSWVPLLVAQPLLTVLLGLSSLRPCTPRSLRLFVIGFPVNPNLSSRPERPDFFLAPFCGASGRVVEGSLFRLFLLCELHVLCALCAILAFSSSDFRNL